MSYDNILWLKLLQNKIFQNFLYIQKGTVWKLNSGLKFPFVLTYSSHQCTLRYRQHNRKRVIFYSTEVSGSLATKEDGIHAKYLLGSFHFLTKFTLQTPCQMSTHRELISLRKTIRERDPRWIDSYYSTVHDLMCELRGFSQVQSNGYRIHKYPVMEMRKWFGIACSPKLCNAEHDFRKTV